jgi:hypothetical protein
MSDMFSENDLRNNECCASLTPEELSHEVLRRMSLQYRHPSHSTVNWFHKNRAVSETALTELHRDVSVQKLKSAK